MTKINIINTLSGILLLSHSTIAFAINDQSSSEYLDLQNAVNIALNNHSDIKIDEENINLKSIEIEEVNSSFWPSLSLNSDIVRTTIYDDFSGVEGEIEFGGNTLPISVTTNTPKFTLNLGLELKYNLYSGGQDSSRLKEANINKNEAMLTLLETKQNIVFEVIRLYLELYKTKIDYDTTLITSNLKSEEMNISNKQLKKGLISDLKNDENTLNLLEAQGELKRSELNLFERYQQYIEYINGPNRNQPLSNNLKKITLANNLDNLNINKIIDNHITTTNPNLKIARQQLKSAQTKIDIAYSEMYPKIDIFAQTSYAGRDEKNINDALDDLDRSQAFIGIQLEWSLFNGFQTKQKISKARSSAKLAKLRIQNIEKSIKDKIQSINKKLVSLNIEQKIIKKQLDIQHKKIAAEKKKLDKHLITQLKFRNSLLNLTSTEATFNKKKADIILAKIELAMIYTEIIKL